MGSRVSRGAADDQSLSSPWGVRVRGASHASMRGFTPQALPLRLGMSLRPEGLKGSLQRWTHRPESFRAPPPTPTPDHPPQRKHMRLKGFCLMSGMTARGQWCQ